MSHHHHDHDEIKTDLSFEEKIAKLLAHWIKHNDDHALTYTDWAKKAKDNRMAEIGRALDEAAEATRALNERFEAALRLMKN